MHEDGLTDIQREIVTAPLGPAVVTAGAGSGKTRVLTNRIAYLLKQDIPDVAILALTFTNKAAAEMKRRVSEIVGYNCNVFLGTFHSWCARFLRANIKPPFDKNFTIYDTKDSDKVWKVVGDGNVDAYKRALEAANALDFDDLLEMTYQILRDDAEIRERLQTDIQYILVDEFQDTDITQYRIVNLLAAKHKNIMVVGDEDQCIYTWRGSNIENLNFFLRDFPNAKIYKLEQNFRSSKNIVDLANRLVANNENRLDKTLFSTIKNGELRLDGYYDERHEARSIAMHIATEHHQNGRDYSDFAILMRLNATSRNFEEQFRAFGIPHIIWGGFKFYERAEVKSTINYLRLLVNPRDENILIDVLNFPKRGIGDGTIQKLRDEAERTGVTLFEVLKNPPKLTKKAEEGIKDFLFAFENLKSIYEGFSLFDLSSMLISTLGLDTYFRQSEKEEDLSRLENLYQLEQAIKGFAIENKNTTLADYLQSVSLIQDTDNSGDNDAVVISTVHSAKGLEFENVFVIGLEDGIFPLARAKYDDAELEEERRLLYVAITRARKNLYLSYAGSRYFQGTRLYTRPSEFLIECNLMPIY